MASYQFPPSSPLAHGDLNEGDSYDAFKKPLKGLTDDIRGRYPTPNPSSTTGRSSSPTRYEEEKENDVFGAKPATRQVSFDVPITKKINRDFNILNPDQRVLRIPLLSNKSNIIIGRSSKSCDFHFDSIDKTISRTHVSIHHTNDKIILKCLGFNGFAMRVPKTCHVFASKNDASYFKLTESKDPLDISKLNFTSRTIKLDSGHTEFAVNRNESVELDKINNIMLEIRNHVALINPLDDEDELTDEETPVLIKNHQGPKTITFTPVKPIESVLTPQAKKIFEITPEEPTPSKSSPDQPVSQPKPELYKFPPQSSMANSFKIFEDHQNSKSSLKLPSKPISLPQRPKTPLNDKTNSFNTLPQQKRKANSEEPPQQKQNQQLKKRKQKLVDVTEKLVIDQNCIENIPNVDEITNILVNHLAFSRLSSTPASFLNTISAVVSKISLKQLRVILHNSKCIGIIYRPGKDAAGKPLEEEYYYMPENDDDGERPKLVSSIRGHGGLRSCRRTHKQYYWKKPAPIKK